MSQLSSGLVMEGGAMRGMFTAGVTDVFMEQNIHFDGAVGVSAGATFGCNLKSHQIGRAIRYNKKYCRDWRYGSFKSVLKTGDIYDADFCYRLLPDELDKFDTDTFASNPMVFYMVATDVETGEPVYYKCTDGGRKDLLWMRASASMPIVSKPVPIDGKKYLDGGISDSIPVHFMEQQKYDRIAVILTQPAEYRKKASALQPLMNLMLHRYPAIAYDMKTRAKRYNDTLDYICAEEKKGNLFVIRPDEALNIGKTENDPAELERVYQLGRTKAKRILPDLRSFISGA